MVGGRGGGARNMKYKVGPAKPPPPPPIPHFEAQIFAAVTTPPLDVGKISLGPPYPNPGSSLVLVLGS